MNSRRHELRRFPWQVTDSGQLLLVVAAGVVLVASVTQTAAAGLRDLPVAVAFGALIAFGEVLRLNLPGDRETAPIGFAGALAYALLIYVGDDLSKHTAQQVVTVTAIGMIIGALPHLAVGRPARVSGMATRLLCVACVAFIFRPLAGNDAVVRHWGLAFSIMTSLTVIALLLEAVLTALLRVEEQGARFRVALVDEMRVQLPLGAAVGASALLIAFAGEVMGLGALAVFTAPLLVTQVAFRRYAGIRATYLQTVRALAKVTEIGGYVETGHSERVSRLAVAVGRELGIHEPELLELEYAALMHDIGQLSLHDPIPGGPAAHRRAGRRGDPAGPGPRLGRRDRPQAERAVPARRGRDRGRRPRQRTNRPAAEQPHHQGGQRLRRPGGQLAGSGPGGRGRAAAPPGHRQRVRPERRGGPEPRGEPPLRGPDVGAREPKARGGNTVD
jgi:hypothetical protein